MLLLCLLIAVSFAHDDPLKAILRSPQATLRAYGRYKAARHLTFGVAEDRVRLGMWRKAAQLVAEENSRQDRTADLELNFFAVMTGAEKRRYLGESE